MTHLRQPQTVSVMGYTPINSVLQDFFERWAMPKLFKPKIK